MALVKCTACSKEISAEAEACIHCGQPMNTAINAQHVNQRMLKESAQAAKWGQLLCLEYFL